jgi:hypothetical protein
MTTFLDRISNVRVLIGLLLLYFLFSSILLSNAEKKINALAGKEVGVIDLTIGYDPAQTLQMVEDYGDAARLYYIKTELLLDTPYPLIYTLLFAVIITMMYRSLLGRPVRYLNFIPFAALLFDYAEIICVLSLLGNYPEQSMTMAILCEIFKLLKFGFFVIVFLLILTGAVLLIARRFRKAPTAEA